MLQRDGHVVMPTQEMGLKTGPAIDLRSVGRNQASTFTGLCNEHDSGLFLPIDGDQFDIHDPKHLFLLAYRSVLKEYHATLQAAQSAQGFLNDSVDAGSIDPDSMSSLMLLAVGRIVDSYETFLYWMELNDLLENEAHSQLESEVLTLPSTRSSLAVSALFPLQVDRHKTEVPPSMILNILPQADGTHVAAFSWLHAHSAWAHGLLPRIRDARGKHLLYELSKLVLEKCENFVLAPDFVDTFTDDRRKTIVQYFSGNMSSLRTSVEMDTPDLMLME